MLLGALLDVAAEFFVFSDVLGKAGSQVPWCVTSLVVGATFSRRSSRSPRTAVAVHVGFIYV